MDIETVRARAEAFRDALVAGDIGGATYGDPMYAEFVGGGHLIRVTADPEKMN